MEQSFDAWMRDVDRHLARICGLTHLDLVDAPFREWYDEEVSAREAAEETLTEWNDFPSDLLNG